jgi:hypothetical protein
MIEYVEVRDSDLKVIGILDTAQSVIWHSVYYGVGDFQIYINLNDALPFISEAKYITRIDNDEVGVIESLLIADDVENGKMITFKGRFAKSILDRRVIYSLSGKSNNATVLSGLVEPEIHYVVQSNAIASSDSARNISILALGAVSGSGKHIVDESGALAEKQVSFDNLLTYTDAVLKEYGLASRVRLSGAKLVYETYEGTDRSTDNTDGNQPIVFSKEYDSLLSSEYLKDTTQEKNVALIGGEGEGIERICTLVGTASGLSRKEMFVDASSISKKYKDENDTEQTYTDDEYIKMLKSQGLQSMSETKVVEDFNGAIDITNGNWLYGRDVFLGDIVTVQENDIGVYKNVRLGEVTEYQDQDGYTVEAVYQGE